MLPYKSRNILFTTYHKSKKKRRGKNTYKRRTKTKWKQKHAFLCRIELFLFAKIGIEKELNSCFYKMICDLNLLFSIDNLLLRYARKASK